MRPSNAFHPVIDACIYPDTLLNYKVGKGGDLNEQLLEDHLSSLPNLTRYYFDYVVPADAYSIFKPAPLKRAMLHPRVALTHVRVVKVGAKMHAMRGACGMARASILF